MTELSAAAYAVTHWTVNIAAYIVTSIRMSTQHERVKLMPHMSS